MAQLTLRIPDDIHTKLRVLAAFKNVSQNDLINQSIRELLTRWEEKYGELPMPPIDSEYLS